MLGGGATAVVPLRYGEPLLGDAVVGGIDGVAGGMELPGSVAPFILRGVSLHGIESVYMPMPRRKLAWERLARDLDMDRLKLMTKTIELGEVTTAAADILAGKVRGRLIVRIGA